MLLCNLPDITIVKEYEVWSQNDSIQISVLPLNNCATVYSSIKWDDNLCHIDINTSWYGCPCVTSSPMESWLALCDHLGSDNMWLSMLGVTKIAASVLTSWITFSGDSQLSYWKATQVAPRRLPVD